MTTPGFFAKLINIAEWTIFLTALFSLLGIGIALIWFHFFPPQIFSPELENLLHVLR